MQITETGYYETRDGGLAYVAGIYPLYMDIRYPVVGSRKDKDGEWECDVWSLKGGTSTFNEQHKNDLVRYIGKELPEATQTVYDLDIRKPTGTNKYTANFDPRVPSHLDLVDWEESQPERVELSKLWVGWVQFLDGHAYDKMDGVYTDKETLINWAERCDQKLVAITPADADGFFPGEGLE